jgi:hypothetical protein
MNARACRVCDAVVMSCSGLRLVSMLSNSEGKEVSVYDSDGGEEGEGQRLRRRGGFVVDFTSWVKVHKTSSKLQPMVTLTILPAASTRTL